MLGAFLDTIASLVTGEFRYRREHPCETASMFRQRAAFWKAAGRKGLARVAGKRADRWDLRCEAIGGEDPC